MVVGRAEFVFASAMAHDFEGTVGDDLVCVHVCGCSGATLNHVDWELVVVLTVDDFVAGLLDSS